MPDGQLHFLRRRLGQEVVGGVGLFQTGQKFLHGKVFGRQDERGELRFADLLGFQRFPGVNPFLLERGQVGGQLRRMVPGVEKKNRGVMFIRIGGMIHRNDRERHLALRQTLVVGEMNPPMPLQRRRRVALPLAGELIPERLDRRVAPQPAHGRIGQDGQRLAGVRDRHHHHRVLGQQLLRRRFRGADIGDAQQRGQQAKAGNIHGQQHRRQSAEVVLRRWGGSR